MTKKFLTFVLPLIAPTIAYIMWIYFRREREEAQARGRRLPPWQEYPWVWLITIGAVLASATIVFFGTLGGVGTDVEYRPARYENGKLIPGEIIDKEEKAGE